MTTSGTESLFAFVRGLTLWRFSRHGNEFAVNLTHWCYFTNHAYPGERRFYVRLGARPGWVRDFGPRKPRKSRA